MSELEKGVIALVVLLVVLSLGLPVVFGSWA